jgi:hypothetical protein
MEYDESRIASGRRYRARSISPHFCSFDGSRRIGQAAGQPTLVYRSNTRYPPSHPNSSYPTGRESEGRNLINSNDDQGSRVYNLGHDRGRKRERHRPRQHRSPPVLVRNRDGQNFQPGRRPQHHNAALATDIESTCARCGHKHRLNGWCGAVGKICRICATANHLAKVCRWRNSKPSWLLKWRNSRPSWLLEKHIPPPLFNCVEDACPFLAEVERPTETGLIIWVNLCDRFIEVCINSSVELSCLDFRWSMCLGVKMRPSEPETPRLIENSANELMGIWGTTIVDIQVGKSVMFHRLYAVDLLSENIILGKDFLYDNKIIIDRTRGVIIFREESGTKEVCYYPRDKYMGTAYCCARTVVPGLEDLWVPIWTSVKMTLGKMYLLRPIGVVGSPVHIVCSTIEFGVDHMQAQVFNPYHHSVVLTASCPLVAIVKMDPGNFSDQIRSREPREAEKNQTNLRSAKRRVDTLEFVEPEILSESQAPDHVSSDGSTSEEHSTLIDDFSSACTTLF